MRIERSALIVTGQPDGTVLASARNLEKTKVLPAAYLNVADMLNHRHVLDDGRRGEGGGGVVGPQGAGGRWAEAPPREERGCTRTGRGGAETPPGEGREESARREGGGGGRS